MKASETAASGEKSAAEAVTEVSVTVLRIDSPTPSADTVNADLNQDEITPAVGLNEQESRSEWINEFLLSL